MQVSWFHEGELLNKSAKFSNRIEENDYFLIIKNLKLSDFGIYTCQATNFLGRNFAKIEVSGKYSITTIFNALSFLLLCRLIVHRHFFANKAWTILFNLWSGIIRNMVKLNGGGRANIFFKLRIKKVFLIKIQKNFTYDHNTSTYSYRPG